MAHMSHLETLNLRQNPFPKNICLLVNFTPVRKDTLDFSNRLYSEITSELIYLPSKLKLNLSRNRVCTFFFSSREIFTEKNKCYEALHEKKLS